MVTNRKNIKNILYHNIIRKLPLGGRKQKTLEYEEYLCKYIDNLRKLIIPISTNLIILEAINKVPDFFGKS